MSYILQGQRELKKATKKQSENKVEVGVLLEKLSCYSIFLFSYKIRVWADWQAIRQIAHGNM